jgi:hypothetical protein
VTFNYSGDPSGSDVDAVRYLIGDTAETGHLVEDEEIQYAIDRWYDVYGTLEWVAASVLDTLAAKYAREAGSISADGVSVSLAGLSEQFAAQAAKLRDQHKSSFVGAQADVGGISPYEGLTPGVKPFAFGKGVHDNRYAGRQDYGGDPTPDFPAEEYPGL